MKKEKAKLPGLVYLFCVSLVFGLLSSMARLFDIMELLRIFQSTSFFGFACFDTVIFFTEIAMFIAMLILITMRKRAFLICFWVDYLCRAAALAAILLLGGQIGSFWTVLVWPSIWALYFYLSVKVSAAFSPYRKPLLRKNFVSAGQQLSDAEQENTDMPQRGTADNTYEDAED